MLLLFLLAVLISCSQQKDKKPELLSDFAAKDTLTKYVGMETCKSCHIDKFEDFQHTGMGLSWGEASKEKSSAVFNATAGFYDSKIDLNYHAYWSNENLHFIEFRKHLGDTTFKRNEKVDYIVGSGQHTNSHIINRNGYLFQAPMTFYTQSKKWDFPPGFENGNNSRFGRAIGLECISCHNAYPEMVLGSENKYNIVPHGIDCERCHGPGSVHVAQKKAGLLVDVNKETDYSIVNPSKLESDLQFDVCQRCHIQGNAVLNPGKTFFDFKPSNKLSDVMNVFMPVYSGQESEHIMASHAERLKMSRCYLESINGNRSNNGSFTCISCHNPHVSVTKTDKSIFNNSCNSCHAEPSSVCTLEEKIRLKENNNCVSCHMEKSGAIDIPHVRVTDHFIKIPNKTSVKSNLTNRQLKGIVAINNHNPSYLSIAKAWIAYNEKFGFDASALDSATYYLGLANKQEELKYILSAQIHIHYLKQEHRSNAQLFASQKHLIEMFSSPSYSNEDAWTCYRMGESFLQLNQLAMATQWIQKACDLAPYQMNFNNRLASLYIDQKKYKQAKVLLQFIIKEQAHNDQALCNLGYLYLLSENDTMMARNYYNRALQYNPDYEQALLNIVGLELIGSNLKEAKRVLNVVLSINPDNKKAKQLLLNL